MDLLQIETKLQHGQAIDDWLFHSDYATVAIFDIDCIALGQITEALAYANLNNIYGAAQQANHIKGSGIYASPAFIVFSKETYDALGCPSFMHTDHGDVGSEITYIAEKNNIPVKLIWPTHVQVPKWDLGKESCFGYGTTYEDKVYHAFEARMGNDKIFVRKCKEVLAK